MIVRQPFPMQSWDDLVRMEKQRFALRELARRELAKRETIAFTGMFTPDYHVGWIHEEVGAYLDAFIEAVEQKQSPRLMIFLPPGSGKSQLVSRCFPPLILGRHPDWQIVTATYGQELASQMGRDVRSIIQEPTYQDLFPGVEIAKDSNSVDYMRTTHRGSYTAVGVGGALTGRRAHVLIIDDPVKGREEADSETVRRATWNWYSATARTRLFPGAGIVILQTRWHEEDLSGMLLAKARENPKADQWKVYSYPAIATEDETHRLKGEPLHPERYGLKELEATRASMSPRDWAALYQQNPVPDDGNFFKAPWLKTFEVSEIPENAYWYVSTDFAIGENETNDWTVMTPFAVDSDHNIYICEPVRARMDAYEIVEKLLDVIEERNPLYVAIEKGHISKTLGPHLAARSNERRTYGYTVWEHTPHRDKMARARSFQGRLQQGKVRFQKCQLFDEYLRGELLAFPAGRWDDFVDTCSLGCLMLEDIIAPAPPPGLPTEDDIQEDSWDDLKRRMQKSETSSSHRPKSLFAHLRKK